MMITDSLGGHPIPNSPGRQIEFRFFLLVLLRFTFQKNAHAGWWELPTLFPGNLLHCDR
jgi:hypothetical protein